MRLRRAIYVALCHANKALRPNLCISATSLRAAGENTDAEGRYKCRSQGGREAGLAGLQLAEPDLQGLACRFVRPRDKACHYRVAFHKRTDP